MNTRETEARLKALEKKVTTLDDINEIKKAAARLQLLYRAHDAR